MMMSSLSEKDAWETFCAAEEDIIAPTDRWGRIYYRDRSPSQVGNPSVSDFLFSQGFRPHYPDGKQFAVCVSHDVDHLFQPGLSKSDRFKEAIKELLSGYYRRAFQYLDRHNRINPYYNIEKLLDIEKKFGIRSTFYFLALKPGDEDYNYRVNEVKGLLKDIQAEGCEIALHGGHTAFINERDLRQEKDELEQVLSQQVKGFRNHFLRFRMPDTLDHLAAAGFSYDSTYGFPDHPGFRNGMCYPYFAFNAKAQKFSPVLEIPPIVMDASFIYYQKFDVGKIFEIVKDIVDQTRRVKGVFTLLWHNNYLYPPWKSLFESILRYCRDSDPWFATGGELNEWWRKNEFCEVYSRYGLQKPAPDV